ncbi:MAG: phosphatidylethanolamine/phosphatidyl-N-methylethanolamine N-methyltransferase [Halobacteriales archaeon]|jgi:phosphatidylethanolamine/phosphatidyl-N-methylethanolamine N-methyltransferase
MSGAVRGFYGRWARLYDTIARYTPGIRRLRERAATALELDPGDTVVEMGTGTGANLPFLREAVGPTGSVVGVDLTRPVLDRARGLADRAGWRNVHLLQGDATRPPVDSADAVLGTFVVGMFDDPAGTVHDWCDLVGAGGNVVLLDATLSDRPYGPVVNPFFRAFVALSTPPTLQVRYDRDLAADLDRKVRSARDALRERSGAIAHEESFLGFARLTGGRIA